MWYILQMCMRTPYTVLYTYVAADVVAIVCFVCYCYQIFTPMIKMMSFFRLQNIYYTITHIFHLYISSMRFSTQYARCSRTRLYNDTHNANHYTECYIILAAS